jgi:hypothetical protein
MLWVLKSCLPAFPLFPKLLISLLSTTQACAHAVHGFWLVEELVELANGPPGGGEVVKGGLYLLGTFDKINCP